MFDDIINTIFPDLECYLNGSYSDEEILHQLRNLRTVYQIKAQKMDEDEIAG